MTFSTIEQTVHIVCAYVGINHVPTHQLSTMIASINGALQAISPTGSETEPEPVAPVRLQPAVKVKDSVIPDHIISLENGQPYRSLKRHLLERGMTPEQYRLKWKLPDDYPMVVATYS